MTYLGKSIVQEFFNDAESVDQSALRQKGYIGKRNAFREEMNTKTVEATLFLGDKSTGKTEEMLLGELFKRNKQFRIDFMNETNEHARMYEWRSERSFKDPKRPFVWREKFPEKPGRFSKK